MVRDVLLDDTNDDGNLDLFVLNAAEDELAVLIGTGGGSFADPVGYEFDLPQVATDIDKVDINGDGLLDLATVNSVSDDVSVLLGNGNGTRRGRAAQYHANSQGVSPWRQGTILLSLVVASVLVPWRILLQRVERVG